MNSKSIIFFVFFFLGFMSGLVLSRVMYKPIVDDNIAFSRSLVSELRQKEINALEAENSFMLTLGELNMKIVMLDQQYKNRGKLVGKLHTILNLSDSNSYNSRILSVKNNIMSPSVKYLGIGGAE